MRVTFPKKFHQVEHNLTLKIIVTIYAVIILGIFGSMCMKKIIVCLLMMVALTGCGHYPGRDLKPDDEFSESVKEEFGDSFHYNAHEESDKYGSYYTFEIHDQNLETVIDFYEFASESFHGCDEKTTIAVGIVQVEGLGIPFSIRNYTDETSDKADLDGLYNLHITHLMFNYDSFWDDLSIYSSFTGIKYLTVTDIIQSQADEEGIDWYEFWPDLESVEVIDTSEWNK